MLFFILSMLCYVIYVQGEIKVLLLFVILRDVVLIKTKSALLPSYEHYMLHVIVLWRQNQQPTCTWFRLWILRFNRFHFHFLVETTNKLLILWEELQLCHQLKQTTMMRWVREASQVKLFFAVFICCVFFSSEWNSSETCLQVIEALVNVCWLGGEPGNIPGMSGCNVFRFKWTKT